MVLLGTAAVAMWWTIAPEGLSEFREWHSKEHFPERMGIAGFLRGSRWETEGGSGAHFVMYEHSGMVRSQCRIAASHGGGIATYMATLTLSPRAGRAEALRRALDTTLAELPRRPGITAAHLLLTDTPKATQTTEQRIRGGDAAADWIVLVSGHQRAALLDAFARELAEKGLNEAGGEAVVQGGPFRLAHAVTPRDC